MSNQTHPHWTSASEHKRQESLISDQVCKVVAKVREGDLRLFDAIKQLREIGLCEPEIDEVLA